MAYPSPRLVALPPPASDRKKTDAGRGGVKNPARRPAPRGPFPELPRALGFVEEVGAVRPTRCETMRSAGVRSAGLLLVNPRILADSRHRGNGVRGSGRRPCFAPPPPYYPGGTAAARRPGPGCANRAVPAIERSEGPHALPFPQ